MSTHRSTLGDCPSCGAEIPTTRLLIEYERADGPAAYAECPGCRTVVTTARPSTIALEFVSRSLR